MATTPLGAVSKFIGRGWGVADTKRAVRELAEGTKLSVHSTAIRHDHALVSAWLLRHTAVGAFRKEGLAHDRLDHFLAVSVGAV